MWCAVVLLYLQASSAENHNIRSVVPLLSCVPVVKRKSSATSLALEDAPVLSGDGETSLDNLDGQFRAIDDLSMTVDAEA